MSPCNWVDLQTLGSQPVMTQNLSNHCLAFVHFLSGTHNFMVTALGSYDRGENRRLVTDEPVEFEK